MNMTELIFLEGNVPSSKNSKQWTGKFLVTSKTVQKYLKQYGHQWKIIPPQFSLLKPSDYPLTIGFHFVRGTRHRWDFVNICQVCLDLMVTHNWIIDDNMDFVIPQCLYIDDKHYSYNKENPGVYIKIMNKDG